MKNQKVYIVTKGCYSEYHVVAVFLNKIKAEEYCDKDAECRIEEYDADSETPIEGKLWYDVGISIDERQIVVRSTYAKIDTINYANWFWNEKGEEIAGQPCYILSVCADGVKKAKAIALERYHAFLAVKETHFPLIETEFIPDGMYSSEYPLYNYFTYEILNK